MFSKPVGSLTQWKLVSFWTLQTTFLSTITTIKQRKLPSVQKPTSSIQSEKPWKYSRSRYKTSRSQRVPLSGWRSKGPKFYLRGQLTPLGTSGRLSRGEGLKTIWRRLSKAILGTATHSAKSPRCSWWWLKTMTAPASLNRTFSTKLRIATEVLKEQLTVKWSLTGNSNPIRVQRGKKTMIKMLSLISQLLSIKWNAPSNWRPSSTFWITRKPLQRKGVRNRKICRISQSSPKILMLKTLIIKS